jgi:hypothetical protein
MFDAVPTSRFLLLALQFPGAFPSRNKAAHRRSKTVKQMKDFLAIAVIGLMVTLKAVSAQTYDYLPPQIAPPSASDLTMAEIAAILNETAPTPPYLVAYRLETRDVYGNKMSAAPLKVIPTDDPDHPYLGVFHHPINSTQFATYLAYSTNLSVWYTLGEIYQPAAQPDMRILPDDSVLYAEEYEGPNRINVRVQYYGNTNVSGLQALIANPAVPPTNAITLPGTHLATADGTPDFGRVAYNGAGTNSTIEINYHYFYLGRRDLDGVGTLTNFTNWSGSPDTATNYLVTMAGGTGKIGDREVFEVGSQVYEVVEVQIGRPNNDYGSWRLFLINKTAGTIQKLSPVLAGGAQSLGNPKVSFVTLPSGVPALVFTCYIFGTNNGTTLPGGHIFVYPLH